MDYEICLEQAKNLESIKKLQLQDKPIVKTMADFIYKFYEYGIRDIEFLSKTVESLLVAGMTAEGVRGEEPTIELSPVSLLRTELLSEDLAPWVRSLRKRLFGKVEAPFTDYDSAVDWIQKYNVFVEPWKKKPAVEVSEPFRRNMLISQSDGGDDMVCARINSPLEKMIFACQKLTKQLEIGLEWQSVVFYVLADIPPFIPPVEVDVISSYKTLPSGKVIKYREANIKLREDFNGSSLRWAYESVRELMQLKRKKEFKVTHLELYRLVQQKGEAPHGKGTVAFWVSVMNEWNKSHPKPKYGTWRAAKVAYERIVSRLSPTDNDIILFGANTKKGA